MGLAALVEDERATATWQALVQLGLVELFGAARQQLLRVRKHRVTESRGERPLASGYTERPQELPFEVIRDQLDRLIEALINLLDRNFPLELTGIRGLQPFLLVAMHAARNNYQAIRYLAADVPKDPSRKPEFAVAIAPLVRSLADLLFTLVFMSEDLPSRLDWYHRGTWRELKEEFERQRSAYGCLAEWQSYLQRYEAALDQQRQVWGISETDADDLKRLPYWPIPGQMLRSGKLSDENQRFLQFLNDWFYRALSAATHMSGAGIARQYVVLLVTKDKGQEEMLAQLKSASVFTALSLLLAICTEVNHLCRFDRETKLSYLWRILVEYCGDAKDLFEWRYNGMLAMQRQRDANHCNSSQDKASAAGGRRMA
jgi:hypothetical protein